MQKSGRREIKVSLFKQNSVLLINLEEEMKKKIIQWWQTAPAAVKNLNISFICCSKYKSRDSFSLLQVLFATTVCVVKYQTTFENLYMGNP